MRTMGTKLVGITVICAALLLPLCASAKPDVAKRKSQAFTLFDVPKLGHVDVVGWQNGDLLVTATYPFRVLFRLSKYAQDDGSVTFESFGKPKFDKKKKQFVIPVKVFEEAPEYQSSAKGVLTLGAGGVKIVCASASCEVLPSK